MSAQQNLEWQFSEDAADPDAHWQARTTEKADRETRQPRPALLYELLLGIALLYGVAVYLIWQQAAQRMAVLEDELAVLQQEITHQPKTAAEPMLADAHPQFETDYLRFETSVRAAAVVQSIVQRVDRTYQQFYRDFGVPLPTDNDKLRIIADPAGNLRYAIMDENTLTVALPYYAAERNGLTLADALASTLRVQLAQYVLGKALQVRTIKPQWQAMTLALKAHLQLDYGYNKDWRFHPTVLPSRYDAQSRPLHFVLSAQTMAYDPTDPGSTTTATAVATAGSVIEFIVARYGYAKISTLLDAFETHESWETLAPAVFGISADALEEQWHAYLREIYPLPTE